jgi:hypothetical protein
VPPDESAVTIRPATTADAGSIAQIWYDGWRDGHLGHIPDELAAVRTRESFDVRAAQRVADTTVATANGVVAGFVMVVDDEVEQVYVDGGRHRHAVAGRGRAPRGRQRPRPGLARGRRR